MGHALHSWYSDHAQNYLNAGYRIFVAEVASTCNEALLIHDLMEKTEDKRKGISDQLFPGAVSHNSVSSDHVCTF